jgi:hypothetical protein
MLIEDRAVSAGFKSCLLSLVKNCNKHLVEMQIILSGQNPEGIRIDRIRLQILPSARSDGCQCTVRLTRE